VTPSTTPPTEPPGLRPPRSRGGAGRPAASVLGLLPLALLLAALPANAGDVEYGAYLAQECSSCHQLHVTKPGIPQIAGLPADYFIQALSWYKEGARENATMRTIARSLDDEQIAALAAYYAQK
jgi:cytochrome c